MIDTVFHLISISGAPPVANSRQIAESVVIQLIKRAIEAVTEDIVVTVILFRAKVDVMIIDSGDTPEVSTDDIIAYQSFTFSRGAIDRNAAASIHRIDLQIIIDESVSHDARRDCLSLLVIAVTIVFHDVIFDESLGRAGSEYIADRNPARHITNASDYCIPNDKNRILGSGAEVYLRHIDI